MMSRAIPFADELHQALDGRFELGWHQSVAAQAEVEQGDDDQPRPGRRGMTVRVKWSGPIDEEQRD